MAIVRNDVATPKSAITPYATPSGYGPSDLQSAYKLNTSGGSGLTVAIVDAYDLPTAASDLNTYRTQYGLPSCTTSNGCFRKVNQTGGSTPPTADAGWGQEIALDLDMVSSACPNCKILLVEANSASMTDLGASVNEAVALGANAVSNSYGGSESSSDTSYDSSYFNHPGVAITVSSGDSGYGTEYPAASQYVTAVGGTSLTTASNTRGWSESAWSGAGSGCSSYDAMPSWQNSTTTGCSRRAEADVSSVADPNTGVAVYDSTANGGQSGWMVFGGTSASSPFIAGVYMLAGAPAAGTYPASYPWAHTGNLFDVTSGSNGSCSPSQLCTARTGWDGPTGWGTPNGSAAFSSGGGGGGNTVTVTNPGNQSSTVGQSVSLQIHATDSGGAALTYSATGLPTGTSINSSTGLISGTTSTAGTFNVTVTAKDSTGASGSTSFTWTVGSGGGGCTAKQLLGNPGFETGSASPWSATAGVISANGSGESSHSGTYFAWLDGYGTTHTDTLSQGVTLPTGCTTYSFSFWLHIDTVDYPYAAYDTLSVQVIHGGTTTTLATFSNLNAASGYQLHSYSLAAYAGQPITVKFVGSEDSSYYTDFTIDDTAINVS
jgi:subtilase family serine protease